MPLLDASATTGCGGMLSVVDRISRTLAWRLVAVTRRSSRSNGAADSVFYCIVKTNPSFTASVI
jgi:hypothetical protein